MVRTSKLLGSAEDIEAAFYDAINRGDIEALMAVWSDDEDIVCVHPGSPRLVGHAAIRASWEGMFERGSLIIEPRNVLVTQNMMMAIHHVIEDLGDVEFDGMDGHILATNVFVKTPLGWRLTLHHASIAPGAVEHEHRSTAILH